MYIYIKKKMNTIKRKTLNFNKTIQKIKCEIRYEKPFKKKKIHNY